MSGTGVSIGGGLFGGESIPVLEAALSFARQRHEMLINNVANVSTPNYRAADLSEEDFQKALEEAIQGRSTGACPLVIGTGRSLRSSADGSLEAVPVRGGVSGVVRADGNDVSLDVEMSKQLKNALGSQIMARLLATKFRMLAQAMRERL